MGSDHHYPEEAPVHRVKVDGFWIDRFQVTNIKFRRFVQATGYETAAQRIPLIEDYPGAQPEDLVAGSVVFTPPPGPVPMVDHYAWWRWQPGADWRHPEGPGSDLKGRDKHPVVHLAWEDVEAYATWAGKALPSEAEWELAASGHEKRRFLWGDAPPDATRANLDGRTLRVDVAALPDGDSPFGCRQMIGNVWEWTDTRFGPYPGFVADPYKEYSEPWFATPHMVLRGGCFATRGRLLRNTWRNFYPPHRRDVLAGFRTCALVGGRQ